MNEPTWIGRSLNERYQIEDLLGQGGMSAVYKATDPNLRRVVAVKIIHSHLSNNPDFVRRFEEEAAAVARLRHNNIIQVYDFNHDGNTFYIIFEFIPGETLQDWLRRLNADHRQLPIADVVKIGAGIADALEYAHQQELIHRDVKPANVMINTRGEPILMDFGIAKIVGGTQHTATGAVLGTARYMSPEQIKGERVTAQTDLYSLGVMLFEMLSGRAPYESDSAMTMMMMHVQDPVPDVMELRADVPPALAEVVYRALSKNPQDRYPTAGAMANALRAAQTGGTTAVPVPPTRPTPVPEPTPLPIAVPPATPPATAASQPPPPSTPPTAVMGSKNSPLRWVGIGVAGILLLLLLGWGISRFASNGGEDENADALTQIATLQASIDMTATAVAIVPESTPEPTEVTAVGNDLGNDAPTATNTVAPTNTPRPTATPLPEIVINNIALNGDSYVVEYDVIGFVEDPDGLHAHFFFDTTPPNEAGRPFSNFFMYPGPSPYNELRLSDKPESATQLCALVANPDHTIQGESGNCVDLPPAPATAGNIIAPPATQSASTPYPTADYSMPPEATTAPASTSTAQPSVSITNIREEGGSYIVEYTTVGFTEQLPGVHIHFFFNTVPSDQAGLPHDGPWYVWGGPRPFNNAPVSDKPASANQMCALVANADHSVRQNTGNCANLP